VTAARGALGEDRRPTRIAADNRAQLADGPISPRASAHTLTRRVTLIDGSGVDARPWSSIRQTSTLGSWQTVDYEPVGVINHLSKLVIVERSVEVDGVPMALVLVVARANG
jgi:hypothetical protein